MKRAWPWVVVGAIAVWLAIDLFTRVSALRSFTTDDAYITLRYADHLASGDGVVWNVGEPVPVEGYSNFLYVVIGAATLVVGGDPVVVFDVLGIAAIIGSAILAWWIARAWMGPLAATAPAIVITAYIGTVLWAQSGLETAVYQCLALGAVALFVHAFEAAPSRGLSRRRLVASGAVAFLVAITRAEGPIVGIGIAIVLGGALLVRRELAGRMRTFAAFALPFAVPYAIYFAWRLVHFEALVPNTVACKSLFASGSKLVFEGYAALALPYLVIAVLRRPRDVDARTLALFVVPLAYAIILRDVDPIISYYNRHALAAWAFLVVAAVVALVRLAALVPRVPVIVVEVVIVVAAIAWSMPMRLEQRDTLERFTSEYAIRDRDRTAAGGWLAANLPASATFVVGDCGLIPYLAPAHAIDVFCLNNRAMTHGASTPRAVADLVFEASPAVIVVHSSSAERLVPRADYGVYPAIVADPRFAKYAFVTRFGSPASVAQYYWIYVRR